MVESVRVVENPISGKILVINNFGDIREVVKVAARLLKEPDCADRAIELSSDGGHSIFLLKPQDRTPDMTATDLYVGLMGARGLWTLPEGTPRHKVTSRMFDSTDAKDGKISAVFNKEANPYEKIYYAAIDAALLSRENGGKSVEFEFRGKTVTVGGATSPESIESNFPLNQRTRADYVPPKPSTYKSY